MVSLYVKSLNGGSNWKLKAADKENWWIGYVTGSSGRYGCMTLVTDNSNNKKKKIMCSAMWISSPPTAGFYQINECLEKN
ncbi:Hypothetical protein CINCED_3A024060 [Cinara cedri]|uniref:Uncharacterized protein n=1 Tax=Cinara cedri TaxID=506608 RepID=A0A5E4MBD3_9HEMI|nr:Hypothetical protein CINCED_3A024060 [Cinara cedri]